MLQGNSDDTVAVGEGGKVEFLPARLVVGETSMSQGLGGEGEGVVVVGGGDLHPGHAQGADQRLDHGGHPGRVGEHGGAGTQRCRRQLSHLQHRETS